MMWSLIKNSLFIILSDINYSFKPNNFPLTSIFLIFSYERRACIKQETLNEYFVRSNKKQETRRRKKTIDQKYSYLKCRL